MSDGFPKSKPRCGRWTCQSRVKDGEAKRDSCRASQPNEPGMKPSSPRSIRGSRWPAIGRHGRTPFTSLQFPPLQRFDGRPVDPLVVFGADDRWSFKDSAWPWGLVGKIFTSSGWTGSGVLVGERLVVTAGHVVPWADVAAGSWWMKFVPAYYDGSSLYGAGVESYVSDAKGFNVSSVVGYDWAILRLYNPLGSSLGYFGFNGYSSGWNGLNVWSGIGYPGAIASGQRPAYQGGYSIIDVDSDSNGGKEIESRSADLTSGNSGGPIFAWWGGDPRIVGVVSGAEQEYWFPFSIKWVNVFAGGSGFTNLIWWGRTNWPA